MQKVKIPQQVAAISGCTVHGCEKPHIAKGYCNLHYLRVKVSGTTELAPKVKATAAEVLQAGSKRNENGCLEWVKTRRGGYGRTWFGGKILSTHVLSWQITNGEIPAGKQINHKCHNRACIDPDHLYVGDQSQNMADMRLAGRERRAHGNEIATAKLTKEGAISIRASEKSSAALAREYCVSESLIRAVKQRKVWAWV
jgi:hypothetical protein